MNKSKKESIILIICAVLLLVSVSYSWMLSKGEQTARNILLDQSGDNRLTIYSSNMVSMSILYLNRETGKYEEWDPEDLVSLKFFDDLAPGDSVDFKLRFRNSSGRVQKMRLSVGGIKNTTRGVTIENSLVPLMYMNVTPGAGFRDTIDPDVDIPDQQFFRLDEAEFLDGSGVMTLYDELTIPSTGAEGSGLYAELDCYFWLDHQAGSEYQDMTMEVGYFRLSE